MTHSLSLHEEEHEAAYSRSIFGFWAYLMTDCVLFATLFATYWVLHNSTFGGPGAKDFVDLPYALTQTLFLLISSFTCGPAMLAAYENQKLKSLAWFGLTFLLGIGFLAMELHEFAGLVEAGNSWQRSAYLSAFFTLVGTHGTHISLGLIWMGTMMGQILYHGFTPLVLRRLTCLRLFWHFLDVVWIFIFTVVYLMGVIG